MSRIENEGPLAGMAKISCLVGVERTAWLLHASRETGYDLDELAQIVIEEAALEHAKKRSLPPFNKKDATK